jgi:PAS domain S-box-containing protein
MTSVSGRRARSVIPWHRRLEARVLFGVTLIAGLSLTSIAFVTGRVVRSHTFDRASKEVNTARAAFETLIESRAESLEKESKLITSLPVFRAYMASRTLAFDRASMLLMTKDYCHDLSATICVVTAADGRWLASIGISKSSASRVFDPFIDSALDDHPMRTITAFEGSLYLVVSQPARYADEVLGSFVAAYRLDDQLARGLSSITRNEIALVVDHRISGTSLEGAQRAAFEQALRTNGVDGQDTVKQVQLAESSYVGGTFDLRKHGAPDARVWLLEDWAPTEQFIDDTVRQLTQAGALVFLLAVVLSIVLSRRMSRPLRDIAERARDIAAGDWNSRLAVRGTAEAVVMAEAFNDMTESLSHWHAEAQHRTGQLQAAYERYAAVTNSAPDAIVSANAGGAIIFWNRGAAMTFGYSEDEALGRPLGELFVDSRALDTSMTEARREGAPARTYEIDARRRDGTTFPCELTVAVWTSQGVDWLTAIVRDITERRRAEETLHLRDTQLRQAQKMEAIGRLASGVAHDFNNALAVIQGYTEDILLSLDETNEHHQDLREVLKASQSAASLTRQLLAFSRKQVIDPQVVSLSEVIGNVQRMLARLVGEQVELHIEEPAGEDLVYADRGQIEQVVVNLCVNARDAMPDGGTLSVRITPTTLDARVAERLGVTPGRFVTVSVADTGHGMDAATASQIFEPFFTTKEAGKGTGLGLATVYGIVRQSGGAIDLETSPGCGTTFHIHLPVAAQEAGVIEEDDAAPRAAGAGTVLLVEDEEPLRAILRRSLETAGYAVLEASSGQDALSLSRTHPEPIDVLLTDVMMPGINGVSLSQQLASERPVTRVLFMSGHTADFVAREGVDPASVRFLQKPFSTDTLCRELRDVLAA